MMTTFGLKGGIYHTNCKEVRMAVNSDLYIWTLEMLMQRIVRIRHGWEAFILHHDITRPHALPTIRAVIEWLNYVFVPHCPYRLDFTPSDFHLFPWLKCAFQGDHNIWMRKSGLLWKLGLWISEDFNHEGSAKLVWHWWKWVTSGWNDIEKNIVVKLNMQGTFRFLLHWDIMTFNWPSYNLWEKGNCLRHGYS
jgi:uncharacterized protein YqcC (DUF446 family)